MTSRDFIHAEAENRNRIILYREGLFWKAYERSAYIVCMQIAPFRPTKRNPKSLDGAEIVSIGFPWSHEEKYLGGLRRVEESADRLVLEAPAPIQPADFDIWKALLPLHVPSGRSKTADRAATGPVNPLTAEAASEIVAQRPEACALPAGESANPTDDKLPSPAGRTSDTALSAAHAVAERVRLFNLAESTPMECMLFISDLKKTLQTP